MELRMQPDQLPIAAMQQQCTAITSLRTLVRRFLVPALFVATALNSSGQTYTTVGNAGTQSAAGAGPNPYASIDNTTRGTRQQYIIRGQELLDAGIPSNAQIVSVGFNITQAASSGGNVQNLSNWQVTLFSNNNPASTSPLGSWVSTPEVASSAPATLNVGATGWKHTTFAAPYVWPGGTTSNLIVQACYNNATTNGNNTNTHARVQRTTNLSTTVGVRSRWLIGSSTSGICSNTDAFATTNEFLRPMVQIGWILEPTPGNTLASLSTLMCGTTALSLQNPGTGFTYQWQSSPDNATWTDIGGATASTYTATPAATTWYRCAVSLSGNPVNSTPVQVTVTAPDPGATTGPTEVACVPAELGIENAQVAGVFYSWESSTQGDVDANYIIVGGSAATFSAPVTEPTWFRCRVECPGTGLFTYSNALLVTPDVPNAGNDASLTVCSTADPTNRFALLGGDAQTGGTWSGPSPVVANSFDPTTMVAGGYTYTVPGTAPCPNAIATVTVEVDPCLGVGESTQAGGIRWLGQDADGGHLVRVSGINVVGWEVFDSAGRSVSSGISPIREELLRIPLGKQTPGIYVIQLATHSGMVALRVSH